MNGGAEDPPKAIICAISGLELKVQRISFSGGEGRYSQDREASPGCTPRRDLSGATGEEREQEEGGQEQGPSPWRTHLF